MARDWIGPALAALVAVAALSMAAATFDSARPDEGFTLGGGGPPDPDRNVGGSDARPEVSDGDRAPVFLPPVEVGGIGSVSAGGGGSLPLGVLVGVVGLLVTAGGLLFRLTGDDDRASADGEAATDRSPVSDAGSSTPVAPSLTNEVYRAWYGLVRRTPLDDRRTVTPGDVAAAAVEDGHPPAPVATLTDEFCRVRYAWTPVTPDAETRARRALDRLDGADGLDRHEGAEGRP